MEQVSRETLRPIAPYTDILRILALSFAALAIAAAPWGGFKHDPKRTGRTPIVGSQAGQVAWLHNIHRYGLQAELAVANGGTIYAGSAAGVLLAFNAQGKIEWRRKIAKDHQITAGIATASDGTLYVVSEDGLLHALDKHGKAIWSFDLRAYAGPSSTPLVGPDGTIYAGADIFYAINPDGTAKWHYKPDERVYGAAAMDRDGTLYFPTSSYLFALGADGKLKWKAQGAGSLGSAPAVGRDGTIYVNSHDGTLNAFSPDGTRLWTFDTPGIVADVPSSPALAKDGTIYFGGGGEYSGAGGYFYALNPDGTRKWSVLAHCDQTAATVGGDGTIYFGSNACGTIHALRPDGSVKWSYDSGTDYARTAPIIGRDGTVYAGLLGSVLYPDAGGLIAFKP